MEQQNDETSFDPAFVQALKCKIRDIVVRRCKLRMWKWPDNNTGSVFFIFERYGWAAKMRLSKTKILFHIFTEMLEKCPLQWVLHPELHSIVKANQHHNFK